MNGRKIDKNCKRLLTMSEKQMIINNYNNINIKLLITAIVVGEIMFFLLGLWFGGRNGVYFFGIASIGFFLWLTQHFLTLGYVVKKVNANKMYASEAIYEKTSGKYGRIYLRGYKKNSIEGYDLVVREPLEKGDRVIVLDMRYPAWVYKARN